VKDYSVEGQLLGHLVMGAQEIAEVAAELNIPQEKSVLLQHLVLSHHGEPEFGAAVRPMCAEAELLHLIDMVDSRMEIYAETLQTMPSGSFSDRIYALEKKIYKPQDMD
ncbi:MAG: 3'-5' exonuclease, partial [Oscillospiraceae bacterium]|nr:3'-5' exonuclease [Oscillospiraceae bacterium]